MESKKHQRLFLRYFSMLGAMVTFVSGAVNQISGVSGAVMTKTNFGQAVDKLGI
jgi:hypothetical protein